MVAAVGADPAAELVGFDIYGVTAGAVDFLSCKEAGLGFGKFSAVRAFNHKFGHRYFSFSRRSINNPWLCHSWRTSYRKAPSILRRTFCTSK
jgi:hypothetical protein